MDQIGSIYGGLSGKSKIDFEGGNARYVTFLGVLENVVIDARYTENVHVGSGESQNPVMKGDLLFNASSETPGDLAIGAVMGEQLDNLYLNSFCFGFRIHDKSRHVPVFLAYFFRGSVGRAIMNSLAQGATRYNMSKSQFRELELSIPPYDEQRAIVEALSDVDGLLNALDALIAKKQAIKQATMQQLLTGKTRLPGFRGAWETKRLGEIAQIKKGSMITEKDVVLGTIPVIAGGQKPAYYHNTANRTGKTITVSASGAYAGFVALYNQPIFASDCSTISESSRYSIDFIYYYLVFNQNVIYNAQTGGAQPHCYPTDLMAMQIDLPAIDEQRAIATVLSDMDAEIIALTQRRDKTLSIKQGMMQQLLTGRVRLFESKNVNKT